MNKKTVNTKKKIPLSPNEEKALKENEEKKKRILRIQQVRNQGKKISENRISEYNTNVEGELKNFINLIKAEWSKNHEQKIDNFFELKKLTKNYIGSAQANAKIQRNEEELKKEKILMKLYEGKLKENERYIEARRKQCQESLEKIKNITNYIKNQYNAVTTSNSREKYLINQYREKQRKKVFSGDDTTFMAFRDEKESVGKKNYNDSAYHRNINVIRCDHQNNVFNASEVAHQKAKQGQLNVENYQKKLRESLQITKERYRKAITKINDEKQKELFIRNLETLEKIDILRKKENIKNSIKDYEEQNIYNNNINLYFGDGDKKNYSINYYTNNELEKIPKEVEKLNKKQWKNVGVLSNEKTGIASQKISNIKKQNDKSKNMDEKKSSILKTSDYSVCDKQSIINQDIIRKVLLHQYP